MKAQELRSGNIVDMISKGKKRQVVMDDASLRTLLTRPSDIYRPAKLTDIHMKEFGFKKEKGPGDRWEYKLEESGFSIYCHQGPIPKFCITVNDGVEYMIEFVHQLQNLYFVLTAKELTLED